LSDVCVSQESLLEGDWEADAGDHVEAAVVTRAHRPRVLTDAARLRIVLESFQERALVSTVAKRYGVDARQLSRWRSNFRAGKLGEAAVSAPTVPVSELAVARQRIRELERELGRKALENAMLLEAVQFGSLAASPRARAKSKRRKA